MPNDASKIIAELNVLSDEVREKFAGLSGEQLNWSSNGWSVGQCLAHIIKSNETYFNELDQIASGTRKNSFWESWSPLSGFAGRFLVKSLKADDKKVRTNGKMSPANQVEYEIVDRFLQHQSELAAKIQAVESANWEKTIVTSPFLPLMTYTLSACFDAIVEHEKRHVRQAQKVVQSADFPAT